MRHLDSNKRLELRILRDLKACVDAGGLIEGVRCVNGSLYQLTIYSARGRVIEQYRLNYERYLHSVISYYRLVAPEKGDCALREAA